MKDRDSRRKYALFIYNAYVLVPLDDPLDDSSYPVLSSVDSVGPAA